MSNKSIRWYDHEPVYNCIVEKGQCFSSEVFESLCPGYAELTYTDKARKRSKLTVRMRTLCKQKFIKRRPYFKKTGEQIYEYTLYESEWRE